ncbi:hypothetical protein EUGRSUZ_I02785 [Eucalyptus grandis]|uniref:Uncharacterized protein n=2 Tax=Eucalyptus grandis TaxID=71139 RepID=A0ACC3JKS3_EUCGR|nr:hypothetical protein EUGRSUZ_I02785 [Eucalyptus grandis]
MKPKATYPINHKFLLLGIFLAFLVIFILRSSFSSSNEVSSSVSQNSSLKASSEAKASDCSPTCSKIPNPLAQALIHYTTSTITPQQTLKEISVTARVLKKKSPCNFLVFGLGHDSLMWSSLNYGGRTIFLEEDEAWIEQIKKRFPMLESYHVSYDSKGLPDEVYERQWDLIMVDAPTGYYEEAPGRMTAIYTAGMMARNRKEGETDVFVHDVNRSVEDKFSKEFLCEGYMKKQENRLRHFIIPSHTGESSMPFCPV